MLEPLAPRALVGHAAPMPDPEVRERPLRRTFTAVIRVTVASMFVRGQSKPSVKAQKHDDLVVLAELVGDARITPVTDRSYALAEAPEAIARVGGRARARDGGAQRVAGR